MGYGLFGPKQKGWSWEIDPRSNASLSTRLYNVGQAVPLYGKDPNMANARKFVAGGFIAKAAAPVVRRHVSFLRRIRLKLDRKTVVSLA